MLTAGQLLAIYAIVFTSKAPGRDRLLDVISRAIDTCPRPDPQEES